MRARACRAALLVTLSLLWSTPQGDLLAQARRDTPGLAEDNPDAAKRFPGFFRLFRPQELPPPVLENSPRLGSMIRDGKLELTLADALALALENNLDIAVQRYIPRYARTDVLRAESGQAARGFQGAQIPGGLSAGALGAGVSAAGAGSGVGSAGGITGGGGSVQVGPSGSFDPAMSVNFSWDRVTSPLNTIQVSGVPTVTGQTTAFTSNYAQLFHQGGSYFLTLNGQRQSSTQQFLRFNPAVVTRFALGFNQPLLNGFGFLPNERFLRVARNNLKVSEDVFHQQVVNTVVEVETAYWDLVALQESIGVAQRSLEVSEQLFNDNKVRLEIGTISPLDVTSAEAEMAARMRDLTIARTNLQMQEATFKNILSRRVTAELDAARLLLVDRLPEPRDSDLPELQSALDTALQRRPDLSQVETSIRNQEIAERFTENGLLPEFAIFGFYAGAGLQGNSTQAESGFFDALSQSFQGEFPEYAGGVTLNIPLRNRVAQADNRRSQLEGRQLQVSRQRSRNQVLLEVRKAIIGMIQGKAQVEAAHQAVRLAEEMYAGEKEKLEAGASTSYQVILLERDLVAAQQAEVNATAGYARALVELDRARGTTLERNAIELGDALGGTLSKMPVTPFNLREQKPESR